MTVDAALCSLQSLGTLRNQRLIKYNQIHSTKHREDDNLWSQSLHFSETCSAPSHRHRISFSIQGCPLSSNKVANPGLRLWREVSVPPWGCQATLTFVPVQEVAIAAHGFPVPAMNIPASNWVLFHWGFGGIFLNPGLPVIFPVSQ